MEGVATVLATCWSRSWGSMKITPCPPTSPECPTTTTPWATVETHHLSQSKQSQDRFFFYFSANLFFSLSASEWISCERVMEAIGSLCSPPHTLTLTNPLPSPLGSLPLQLCRRSGPSGRGSTLKPHPWTITVRNGH